jgi:hypothetical protein
MSDSKSTLGAVSIAISIAIGTVLFIAASKNPPAPAPDSVPIGPAIDPSSEVPPAYVTHSVTQSMPIGPAPDPTGAVVDQYLEANSRVFNAQVSDEEYKYNYYLSAISSDRNLGPTYVERYKDLTKGNYRYGAKIACYLVYAFSHGWQYGYADGLELDAHVDARWKQAQSYYDQWIGVNEHERCFLWYEVDSGWRAGRTLGRKHAGYSPRQDPQPTPSDFETYCTLPGNIYPNLDDLPRTNKCD